MRGFAWIAALLLIAAAAAADDIYPLRGNRPLAKDVKVVEEGEKVVYVDKSLKRRSWPKSSVGRIVKKRSVVHEYYDRYEAAATGDDAVAVAAWAKEQKFHKSVVQALYERALELDPQQETANRALGRVQHGGEWMTPAEREQRLADSEAEAMRAKGLVRWKDQWVTPEDKAKLEKGLRKYKGEWLTEDEIKEAQGLVKHEGKWIPKDDLLVAQIVSRARKETGLGDRLKVHQTPHYAILGDLPDAQMQDLGKAMERLFAEFVRIVPDAKDSPILEGKHRLYAFRKSGPYKRFVPALYERSKVEERWSEKYARQEKQRMKLRLRETSFWEIHPYAMSAHVQMPDPYESLRAHCVHFGANILITRYSRTRFPTWWLNEGLAYYFEKKVTGTIQTFNIDIGVARYADQGPGQTKANPWLDAAKWDNLLLNLVRAGRDPKLDRMKSKNLYEDKNRLTAQDLAKALSVVTFLVLDDGKKFAAFLHDAKHGSSSDPVEREVSAVIKHYGNYGKIEERWKQFALNGFRIAR